MPTKPRQKKIRLAKDAEHVAKLRRKLEEYDRRLAGRAPDADPHATYKRLALKALLDNGILDAAALCADCGADDWFDGLAFEDAIFIIDAYNRGDLSNVHGGTGLK